MPRQLSSATFNEYGNSLVLRTKTRRTVACVAVDTRIPGRRNNKTRPKPGPAVSYGQSVRT
ncbi:hypothetical protein SMJ63A_10019 [Stenotrophomonas geniculata]